MPPTLDEQIFKLHSELNRADIVPRHCYRRNKVHYDLVCYINNIIGLLNSENLDVVPVFVGRALQHMNDFPAGEESATYYEHANRYLRLIGNLVSARGIPLGDTVPQSFKESLIAGSDPT
ncbi:hypothetical protein [Pseudaquabacterium rugosum]|uniref:Uncharacterized protein n=1 Tax=Pseudaquabacterium rugosum TaxID=2984194 RepID=A0ABU9BFW2_9BURK